jgi:hypothetical protein
MFNPENAGEEYYEIYQDQMATGNQIITLLINTVVLEKQFKLKGKQPLITNDKNVCYHLTNGQALGMPEVSREINFTGVLSLLCSKVEAYSKGDVEFDIDDSEITAEDRKAFDDIMYKEFDPKGAKLKIPNRTATSDIAYLWRATVRTSFYD